MPRMGFPVPVNRGARKYFLLAAVATALATSLLLYAGPPSDTIYGNFIGIGTCPPGAPTPCANTAALDNVFIERFDKPETDEQRQIREMFGFPKADSRVAIRIFRDYGHTCAFEGEMFRAGDHLEFKDKPPPRGVIPITCRLQLWEKNGGLELRDPGNECSEKFCFFGPPPRLDGMRFTKGPDQLLAASRKSAVPPPASIFGTYKGTGKCATDERKSEFCNERDSADYIVIGPSESADAHVSIGRNMGANEGGNYCQVEADAMWLGNHLAVVEERKEERGSPHLLQFWFKGDTVVVRDVGGEYCGALIQGGYFKKSSLTVGRDTKR